MPVKAWRVQGLGLGGALGFVFPIFQAKNMRHQPEAQSVSKSQHLTKSLTIHNTQMILPPFISILAEAFFSLSKTVCKVHNGDKLKFGYRYRNTT